MSINLIIKEFVEVIISSGYGEELDRIYLCNRIANSIGENYLSDEIPSQSRTMSGVACVRELVSHAQTNGVIGKTKSDAEMLESELLDYITPRPSKVNKIFNEKYNLNPVLATDYFYKLCKDNNYIKTDAIAKNIIFLIKNEYGEMEITINLSKPEKNPKQILAEKNAPSVGYPKCMLCLENEGYQGRVDYPARANHRVIRMAIDNEQWGFQYSPYSYYNEHAILLSLEHRPMNISEKTFQRLLTFIEKMPHYFIGSNADLPIVGGSILTHDHYQAGQHEFPMAKAVVEKEFELSQFKSVSAGIVKWPMSVIRLCSNDKKELTEAATHILDTWQSYSDESVNIRSHSKDGTPHHTVTPIARMVNNKFELDLVLRDNNVSDEFPDGIFHPHVDVQHIKKENIGLIEVMGLAVLPPRLADELEEVALFLLGQANNMAVYHQKWAKEMKENNQISKGNIEEVIRQGVGVVFTRVLTDAGVFKRDTIGREAFSRFVGSL